jgi:hypothetical protein
MQVAGVDIDLGLSGAQKRPGETMGQDGTPCAFTAKRR